MSDYTIPTSARDVVFFDTETSGLDPYVHEIIELAAIRMTANLQFEKARLDIKCTLTRPDVAESKALEVNRYSAAEWKRDAKPIRVALVDFAPLVDADVILVGHNPHFDWAFMREAYRRESLEFPRTKYIIDTVSIVYPLAMAGHLANLSLETICSRYGIENDGSHRAMTDVKRTARAYAKVLGMAEPRFGVRPPPPQPAAPTIVHRDIKPDNVVLDPFAGVPHEEEVPEWAR